MGMKPRQYWDFFVYENYSDFKRDPTSLRLAFNAAVSCYHLADHVFEFSKRHFPRSANSLGSVGKYTDILIAMCPEFRDIYSISLAYKHLYVQSTKANADSPGSLLSVSLDDVGDEMLECCENVSSNELLILRRKNGPSVAFVPIIDAVVKMWGDEIVRQEQLWRAERSDASTILCED
ncbi:hypothetical protein H0I76_18895 [Limibaculum sp. M0105]|uniref:Uncharacterized protein n=1 Tax=Thermohalobaculum xanthum TaxID=2753746 RepID=A0A8J7SJY1_9RHOB|nr:hypothetical protein [Thermohalobaculum xanthum]MBK0401270.1 hypothetical protein [Thermohalobaculum xanthum]